MIKSSGAIATVTGIAAKPVPVRLHGFAVPSPLSIRQRERERERETRERNEREREIIR